MACGFTTTGLAGPRFFGGFSDRQDKDRFLGTPTCQSNAQKSGESIEER